jgi:protein-S-isoprenylcysteine O-methyltransferase Ste14
LRRGSGARVKQSGGDPVPVIANLAAVGLFIPSLFVFSGPLAGVPALMLGFAGSFLAVAAAALVFWSRVALGNAWSLVPEADAGTGLVTTGPYRVVRHPIYLGLALMATGQALAFGSGPALAIVLFAIVPTFAWRARAEERLLAQVFGARYDDYRRQTKMIIPYLL